MGAGVGGTLRLMRICRVGAVASWLQPNWDDRSGQRQLRGSIELRSATRVRSAGRHVSRRVSRRYGTPPLSPPRISDNDHRAR